MKKKYIMLILVIFLIPIILFNSITIAKTDINDRQNTNMKYTPQHVVPVFIMFGETNCSVGPGSNMYYKVVEQNGYYYGGYLRLISRCYFRGALTLIPNPYQ